MDTNEFDDLLGEAEQEPVDTRTVNVCVKPSVARERATLLKALEEAQDADRRQETADARLGAAPEPAEARTVAAQAALDAFDEQAQRAFVTLKFTRLEGDLWARLTSAFPMRIDVALDRQYGYNFDEVTRVAARKSGLRVTDEGEYELTDEQWDRLFRIIAGHDHEQIRDAVWTINEWLPEQYIAALVKGSGAA